MMKAATIRAISVTWAAVRGPTVFGLEEVKAV
jgi:hypothetical protein